MKRETKKKISDSAVSGIVALVFLILGFQIAVFILKVAGRSAPAPQVESHSTQAPDTLVSAVQIEPGLPKSHVTARSDFHQNRVRPRERFLFNPNTVSEDELIRMGFSPRQAASIINYRQKGGRFSRKEDFAKMYAVSDSAYRELEPYIHVPKVEINSADSAALVSLRGIGPFFARRIIEYRKALGGFYCKEQLMEIRNFNREKFEGIEDCIEVDSLAIRPMDFWRLSRDSLEHHPYVGCKLARSVERYKKVCDSSKWHIDSLVGMHILTPEDAHKLKKYVSLQDL